MATALLKLTDVQLGTSATATNNFTIYQPASPDGTLRIGNGNSGAATDRVTITSAGYMGLGVAPNGGALLDLNSGTSAINTLRIAANNASSAALAIANSASNAYGIYDSTSAQHYFAGNVFINTTSQYGTQKLSINGGIAVDGQGVTNPGICEKGDTDTGIYWPTTNAVGVTTAGVERMRINSSGYVTKPYQPSFSANRTTSYSINSSNSGVTYNQINYNVGSCYNNSTGLFTAPVAGIYLFRATCQPTSSGVYVELRFSVNGTITNYMNVAWNTLPNRGDMINVVQLQLSANDTVGVNVSTGGNQTFDNNGVFFGYLLG